MNPSTLNLSQILLLISAAATTVNATWAGTYFCDSPVSPQKGYRVVAYDTESIDRDVMQDWDFASVEYTQRYPSWYQIYGPDITYVDPAGKNQQINGNLWWNTYTDTEGGVTCEHNFGMTSRCNHMLYEFTGYFMTPNEGLYNFEVQIGSDSNVGVWFGTPSAFLCGDTTKFDQKGADYDWILRRTHALYWFPGRACQAIHLKANVYYPVRIVYQSMQKDNLLQMSVSPFGLFQKKTPLGEYMYLAPEGSMSTSSPENPKVNPAVGNSFIVTGGNNSTVV